MTSETLISKEAVRRRRLMLILIALLFLGPVIGARWYYNTTMDVGPESTTNHGVLIRPARPLDEGRLTNLQGAPLGETLSAGKWTVIHIEDGGCDDACLNRLYNTRQIRIALNKDIPRVQRLLILLGEYSGELRSQLGELHPELVLASGAQERLSRFLEQFEISGRDPAAQAQRVYLADPLGNLMMWYPADQDPRGLLHDLRKLLKVSQIG